MTLAMLVAHPVALDNPDPTGGHPRLAGDYARESCGWSQRLGCAARWTMRRHPGDVVAGQRLPHLDRQARPALAVQHVQRPRPRPAGSCNRRLPG
jgi:hypothetical protein